MRPRSLASVLLILATASPASAQLADRVFALMRVPGVSGHEEAVREAVEMQLPAAARLRADNLGNIVLRAGQQGPMTLVVAPLDESGFVVSAVTDDGYLRVHRHTTPWSGPLAAQWFVGQPVEIHTAAGTRVPGVFATPSTHLSGHLDPGERTRIRTLDDLWIDVGAESAADVAAIGIRLLDSVSLRERATRLAGGRLAGVAATQRAAAQSLVEVVFRAGSRPRGAGRIGLAWTAQSQFGHRGLLRVVAEAEAQRLVILRGQLAPADVDQGTVGIVGHGPIIADDDTALAAAARAAGVTVQTLPAARLRAGLPTDLSADSVHVVALPATYAHTPVETIDTADVERLVRLLQAVTGIMAADDSETPAAQAPEPADAGAASAGEAMGHLGALIEAYGVSGHEGPVRERILAHLPSWAAPDVDKKGNIVVRVGRGEGGQKSLLFVAHMDEVGFEITSIDADGRARVRARGGMYLSVYEGHPVVVVTPGGLVPAVVAPRAGYTTTKAYQPGIDDLALDFGTRSAEETRALGVAAGMSATVRKQLVPLANGRFTGRAMDDRNGCAALIRALHALDPSAIRGEVVFAWVVEEETGLAGARAMVEALERPHTAFAVDTFVTSETPVDVQRLARAPLGRGAVLRGLDSRTLVRAGVIDTMLGLAREAGVPVQLGVTSGGTDASAFSETGAIDVGLSWPGRYSHSPVEIMDQRDQDALVKLIVLLAQRY
ncbi:MAG: M20/M25/M40 family metallo-hydrolase [Acidobacteriota bacterium]